MTISPNPGRDHFFVSCPDDLEIGAVTIFNSTGKEMLFINSLKNQDDWYVPMNNYVSGIYFIQVQDIKGNRYTYKWILME